MFGRGNSQHCESFYKSIKKLTSIVNLMQQSFERVKEDVGGGFFRPVYGIGANPASWKF